MLALNEAAALNAGKHDSSEQRLQDMFSMLASVSSILLLWRWSPQQAPPPSRRCWFERCVVPLLPPP